MIILILIFHGIYIHAFYPENLEDCKMQANKWVEEDYKQAVCIDKDNDITLTYYSDLKR